MSKKQLKEKEVQTNKIEEGTGLVDHGSAPLPAVMTDMDQLAADAGLGNENITANDLATPIISILQGNSPQCKKSDGKFIPGASEGDLFNNVTGEVIPGAVGITIVDCYFEKVFIEWKPNRGGFVAAHPANTPLRDQVIMVKNDDGKEIPTLPNGNNLTETNQHYVLVINPDGSFEPAVIAMTSSALRASRTLNTLIDVPLQKTDKTFFKPARYARTFHLKTGGKVKGNHSWSTWIVSGGELLSPSGGIYQAAKAMSASVKGGSVRVKQEQFDDVTPAADKEKPISY